MDFPNLTKETTRHGKTVYYYRRGRGARIRLRAEFGTPEFLRLYKLAEQGKVEGESPRKPRVQHPRAGTLRDLIVHYYRSPEYRKELDPRTQKVRRLVLDRLCLAGAEEGKPCYGDRPVAQMAARHVRKIRDEMADRPGAANDMLKTLRRVLAYGLESEYPGLKFNPARDVKLFKAPTDGFIPWTLEHVQQFERRHPVGTKARLALALLLYTGQRRSDVVTFGPALLKDGWLTFTQYKNRNRNPVTLSLPVVPELRSVIDATEVVGTKTWLVTEYGKPFTANGFGNWFRERCKEAGVPGRAHGLRKAAASRLAELGCTEKEIMAITGHRTTQEVARYTKSASQRILAASAMEKFSGGGVEPHAKTGSESNVVPAPFSGPSRTEAKTLE